MGRFERNPEALRRRTAAIRASALVCPTIVSARIDSRRSIRSRSVSSRRSIGTSASSATTSAICSCVTCFTPRRRARAPARSTMPTALSGSALPGRYRTLHVTLAASASCENVVPWCLANAGATCSSARNAASGDSSTTSMAVNLRDSAASESMARRYSSIVVAPMHGSSPRRERDLQLAGRLLARFAAEQRVHLVEEHDDAPVGPHDLRLDLHDPFGERAPHARPADERRRLDLDHDAIVERLHVGPFGDPLRDPAHARSSCPRRRRPRGTGCSRDAWRARRASARSPRPARPPDRARRARPSP